MDTGLLCDWLGLPRGAWPPDDRTLLGLPPGPADPAAVETCALEKMERLRPHQLLHPELVTEGMNRLAQALVNLAAAGPAPSPAAEPPPRKKKIKKKKRRLKPARAAGPPPASETLVLDAEVIAVAEPAGLKLAPGPGFEVVPDEVPAAVVVKLHPPAGTAFDPKDRRRAYRELAQLRRCVRAWDAFRTTAADPSEQLLTPGRVLEFLQAVKGLAVERAHAGWPAESGMLLRLVAAQPLPLAVFRSLVRPQRTALAADWATGRQELLDRGDAIRESLRASRRRSPLRAEWRSAVTWFRGNPEWLPATLFALALTAALMRTAGRR